MYRALEKGLSFKTTFGNVLTLTPPLTITEAEMVHALDIIDEAIEDAQRRRAAIRRCHPGLYARDPSCRLLRAGMTDPAGKPRDDDATDRLAPVHDNGGSSCPAISASTS